MRACDDDDGSPAYQVMRFQAIAPRRPARMTVASTTATSTSPLPIVFATAVPNTKNAKVEDTRPDHRRDGREDARRDDGGDRVRRVVEAVDEVEGERHDDDRQDEPDGSRH